MNNDKWLCTVTIFEKEDGSYGVNMGHPPKTTQMDVTKTLIMVGNSLKGEFAGTLGIYNPYPPAPQDTPTGPQDT